MMMVMMGEKSFGWRVVWEWDIYVPTQDNKYSWIHLKRSKSPDLHPCKPVRILEGPPKIFQILNSPTR